MTLQPASVIEFLPRLEARSPATHRSITVSIAIRALVVGAAVLCVSGARDRGDGPRRAALGEPGDLDLLQKGITLIPQSHVSVSKTEEFGEIILRAGDQVELRRVGQKVEFRLARAGADRAHCARSTLRSWELPGLDDSCRRR
jgi:hypothetical protein